MSEGYLHPKGTPQAPKNSEYEIEMNGVYTIIAAYNAVIFKGSWVKVVDEKKPAFIIALSIEKRSIWELNEHLNQNQKGKPVNLKSITSNDIGAMLSETADYQRETLCFNIRRGDEEYFCGEDVLVKAQKTLRHISHETLLQFVAGDTKWGDLKKHSTLFEKKRQRRISAQEKNRRLQTKIIRANSLIENRDGTIITLNRQLRESYSKFDSCHEELTVALQKVVDAKAEVVSMLEKLPAFIQYIFLRDSNSTM